MDDEIRDLSGLNIDQVLRQLELDEKEDAPFVTPVDYAKLRLGIAPQNVYYHIRAGHIRTVRCPCGRKCVVAREADEFFRSIGKLPPIKEQYDEQDDQEC